MAKEGADMTLVYLPEEQVCADETKKMIENEARECHLFAGDLTQRETCRRAVEEHIKRYGKKSPRRNFLDLESQLTRALDLGGSTCSSTMPRSNTWLKTLQTPISIKQKTYLGATSFK